MMYIDPSGHWEKRDELLNKDAQVKILLLTEAYYAAKTPEEKKAIQNKAIDIRNDPNSQALYDVNKTVKRDTLVDFDQTALNNYMNNILKSGYVSQGDSNYALTQIVNAQNLSIKTNYATFSTYSPLNSISTTKATADVGKVNYTVSSSYTEYKNSSIVGPSKAEIKTTAHYSAYYFYLPEWESEMKDGIKQLAKTLGISEDDIGTMTVVNKDELTYGWNAIGKTSAGNNVSAVVINTHGRSTDLSFGEYATSNSAMASSDFSKLQSKDIDNLIILSCNAGHLDNPSDNPAASFVAKIKGGKVLASDGTVYYSRSYIIGGIYSYNSFADSSFREQSGDTRSKNNGWIIYQVIGGTLNTTNVADWVTGDIMNYNDDLYLSIPEMLEKMK